MIDMNAATMKIVGDLGGLAVDGNRNCQANFGILFNTITTVDNRIVDEAWAQGDTFIARWSECGKLNYDLERPFYAVESDMFQTNRFPHSADEMRRRMEAATQVLTQSIRLPIGNVYNAILANFPGRYEKARTRVLFNYNPGYIQKNTIVLIARKDLNKERMVLRHPKLPEKTFVVDEKYSVIAQEHLVEGTFYQCFIVDEVSEEEIIVNVKAKFFQGIEVLFHISEAGYFPDEAALYDSTAYDDRSKVQIPLLTNLQREFQPVHFDCTLLFDILSAIKDTFVFVDIHISDNPEGPLLFVGVRDDPSYPLVEILAAPLSRKNRGSLQ